MDIQNQANHQSSNLSLAYDFGPTPPKPAAPASGTAKAAEPAPQLGLPSHQDNDVSSTTFAVTDGITFVKPDGTVINTDHIRAELEGANQVLADPAEEDVNAAEIFLGTMIAVETTNQVGNFLMYMDGEDGEDNNFWAEGGAAGVHALNAALVNVLTGGDSSDGFAVAAATATSQLVMPLIRTGDDNLDQTLSSVLEGITAHQLNSDFDSASATAAFADTFNRQMHDKEI